MAVAVFLGLKKKGIKLQNISQETNQLVGK
jgi:hypothetical protein